MSISNFQNCIYFDLTEIPMFQLELSISGSFLGMAVSRILFSKHLSLNRIHKLQILNCFPSFSTIYHEHLAICWLRDIFRAISGTNRGRKNLHYGLFCRWGCVESSTDVFYRIKISWNAQKLWKLRWTRNQWSFPLKLWVKSKRGSPQPIELKFYRNTIGVGKNLLKREVERMSKVTSNSAILFIFNFIDTVDLIVPPLWNLYD